MEKHSEINFILHEIFKLLSKQKETPFYNEPIFLTLLSILLGGIVLTLISKYIEERSKRRSMVFIFLEEIGLMLSTTLATINGHIKRKDYGPEMETNVFKKKSDLFVARFSVRTKSKAYLRNNEFWKKYDYIIYEIDILIHLLKKGKFSDGTTSIVKIRERIDFMERFWPINKKEAMEHDNKYVSNSILSNGSILDQKPSYKEANLHDLLKYWVGMVWIRSNLLIHKSLEAIV